MPQPKVVFVVGHSNWGKSQTLRALTSGNSHTKRAVISGIKFFIRRMSNDDKPESFIDFMNSLDPDDLPCVIAALCPNFEDPEKGTTEVLQKLRDAGYKLYFWVMEQKYGSKQKVTSRELSKLREFGKVELFSVEVEAADRAKNFIAFIERSVA